MMAVEHRIGIVLLAGMAALCCAQSSAAVPASQPASGLLVDGQVSKPLLLTLEALGRLPHQSVAVTEHDGTMATYSGVPLRDILLQAGAPIGPNQLRGKNLGLYVVAEGADGYKAVIALPEIDAEFTDATILVADKRDGQPLDAKSGPLKLIVPQDKKQARWVRLLIALHLRHA